MNKTTKELVEAARSVLPFLSRFSPERDRLRLAIAEVEAEEQPQTQSIKDHPLYAEITGQVHHIGGKP